MTNLSKEAYKGCRDFFPKEKRKLNFIFDKMKACAEAFGYENYDGPLLESVDLYLAKSGEELINEQIYRFTDRGDRQVAIRPEMTPTLARMIAQIHRETPKPIRWYAIPNLMRYEKPQKGRLREHWQFNGDIFGAPAGKGETEILMLIFSLFKSFGANQTHVEFLLNDRRIVEGFFTNRLGLAPEIQTKLYKIVDRSKKITLEALDKQLQEISPNGDVFKEIKNYLSLRSFEDLKKFLVLTNLEKNGEELFNIVRTLESNGLKEYLYFDPSIVRGLDYYTGLVFEVFDKHPENKRAICGGGAYANLLQIFNEPSLPAVGFGMGDVTLTDFLETHNLIPKTFLPQIDLIVSYQVIEGETLAWELSSKLRNEHLKVEMMLGDQKPKKVFQLAESKQANFVIFIGEREVSNKTIQIKNLKTNTATDLTVDKFLTNSILDIIKTL